MPSFVNFKFSPSHLLRHAVTSASTVLSAKTQKITVQMSRQGVGYLGLTCSHSLNTKLVIAVLSTHNGS